MPATVRGVLLDPVRTRALFDAGGGFWLDASAGETALSGVDVVASTAGGSVVVSSGSVGAVVVSGSVVVISGSVVVVSGSVVVSQGSTKPAAAPAIEHGSIVVVVSGSVVVSHGSTALAEPRSVGAQGSVVVVEHGSITRTALAPPMSSQLVVVVVSQGSTVPTAGTVVQGSVEPAATGVPPWAGPSSSAAPSTIMRNGPRSRLIMCCLPLETPKADVEDQTLV